MAPHSSQPRIEASRLTPRNTRRPAASVSRIARASAGVSASRLAMPRVSATLTTGHGAGGGPSSRIRPLSHCHHSSTLGVALVSNARSPSRRARSSAMSRVCMRGAPGGLWAASCSSISATVAPAGSGARRADRVPTASVAWPPASACQACDRSASATPESRRTTWPSLPRRCAQRAAPSMSAASTSVVVPAPAMRSISLASRPAPMRSSGVAGSQRFASALARGIGVDVGGGMRVRHVEPKLVALSAAMQPPAELADRLARLEQRLAGHAPERQHDLRIQHAELGVEEPCAGSQLVGLRIAIARWAAFDRVGDVHLVARELDRFEHLREQLAGAAHEGLALCVLLGARALADDDELGAWAARAEHDRVALLAQRAAAAALEATLLGGQRLGRAEEVVAGQAELAHAEIAVVTERVAERAQGNGQERARIVGQRLIRSPRAVARTVSRWLKIASATAALLIRGSPRSPPQRSSRSTSLSSASKPMPD